MEVFTPRTLDEALRLKAEHPEARFIQGGTDVMVELTFGGSRPRAIVNLAELAELRGWSRDNGSLRLGAGLTYTEAMTAPLADTLPRARRGGPHRRLAADPEPRHDRREPRHGVPAGDALPPLLVERAEVELASIHGVRAIPLEEFLVGVKRTALEPDELITAVRLAPSGGAQTFMKVGPRNAMVIAICSLAVVVDADRGEVRAAFGSAAVTARLVTVPLAEAASLPERVVDAAAPIDDVRATAAYRRHALTVLASRALERCLRS